jgi:flagellar protein FlaG
MSNDITPSRLPPPQAAPGNPSVKPADAARPQQIETPKAVAEKKPDPKETRRALEEATELLNKQISRNSRDLNFSIDDVTNKVVVTVKNRESGEVVRQIPTEVAIRVAHNIDNMKGLLQDGKS